MHITAPLRNLKNIFFSNQIKKPFGKLADLFELEKRTIQEELLENYIKNSMKNQLVFYSWIKKGLYEKTSWKIQMVNWHGKPVGKTSVKPARLFWLG